MGFFYGKFAAVGVDRCSVTSPHADDVLINHQPAGFFAVVCPFVTQVFMERGQTYEEASTNAAIVVMLCGFVFIEALVEL